MMPLLLDTFDRFAPIDTQRIALALNAVNRSGIQIHTVYT